MIMSSLVVFTAVVSAPFHSAVRATDPGQTYTQETRAFRESAVSDSALSDVVGTGSGAFKENFRAMTEAHRGFYAEQIGETSRVAMDNWWAQTGAALVINNKI